MLPLNKVGTRKDLYMFECKTESSKKIRGVIKWKTAPPTLRSFYVNIMKILRTFLQFIYLFLL